MNSPPNNLPLTLSSFIGREDTIVALMRLLSDSRLVTLTGAGGSGKTRLAVRVGAGLLPNFADGVWFVDLAPLVDPALVPQSIAGIFGILDAPGQTLTEALTAYLRERQLLLLMDNCEHLLLACAQLAEALLQVCPQLTILATSRESFTINGEITYRVPPLPTPDAELVLSAESLAQFDAIRLFCERARAALASFELSDQNGPSVAHICRRLDGMPLAIELAAARIRAMGAEQIAARLDDRFRLLTGGSRTALPRQQTLRGTLDWSHGLLLEAERILLRRLSVFAGGWTLEAAEAVCSDVVGESHARVLPGQPRGLLLLSADILDLLTRLVDKSLVLLDEQAAAPRYRMLETIRQYAREKLLMAGESRQMRDQHLAFFQDRVETIAPRSSQVQREWLAELESEFDNLRAAFDHACESDLEAARLLAGRLCWFWRMSIRQSEGLAWYQRVLGPGAPPAETRGMAVALLGAGILYSFLLALDDAESFINRALPLWRALGDQAKLVEALAALCFTKIHQGQSEAACVIYEANQSLIRQAASPLHLAGMLNYWGRALVSAREDYAGARILHEEALALGRRWQDLSITEFSYTNLGYLATQQGDFAAGKRYMLDGLALMRQADSRGEIPIHLGRVADVAYLQGDLAEARTYHTEALTLFKALGDRAHFAHISISLGYVAVDEEALEEAAALFAESLAIARQGQFQLSVARSLGGYAHLRLAQGQFEQATRVMASGVVSSHTRSSHIPADRIKHQRTLAALRTQLGEARFAKLWAEGSAMSLDQTIAEAERVPPTEPVVPSSNTATPADPAGLSARESEVLRLVSAGFTDAQIAGRLVISRRTVSTHLSAIYSKLGVHTRSDAILYAHHHKLA